MENIFLFIDSGLAVILGMIALGIVFAIIGWKNDSGKSYYKIQSYQKVVGKKSQSYNFDKAVYLIWLHNCHLQKQIEVYDDNCELWIIIPSDKEKNVDPKSMLMTSVYVWDNLVQNFLDKPQTEMYQTIRTYFPKLFRHLNKETLVTTIAYNLYPDEFSQIPEGVKVIG